MLCAFSVYPQEPSPQKYLLFPLTLFSLITTLAADNKNCVDLVIQGYLRKIKPPPVCQTGILKFLEPMSNKGMICSEKQPWIENASAVLNGDSSSLGHWRSSALRHQAAGRKGLGSVFPSSFLPQTKDNQHRAEWIRCCRDKSHDWLSHWLLLINVMSLLSCSNFIKPQWGEWSGK